MKSLLKASFFGFAVMMFVQTLNAQTPNYITKYATSSTFINSSIFDNGKIGIGTTDPQAPVHIAFTSPNNINEIGLIIGRTGGLSTSGVARGVGMAFLDGSNNTLIGGIAGVRTSPNSTFNGDLAFFVNNTGGASSSTTFAQMTERMRITSSGNVGIGTGTVTPTAKLDVIGAISSTRSSTTGYSVINFATGTGSSYDWQFYTEAVANPKLHLYKGGSGSGEKLTIDNTGKIGIGTTVPAHKLDVEGDIRTASNYFLKSVGDGAGIIAYDGWPAPGPGSTIFSITRQANNEMRFQTYGFHTFYSGGSTGTEKMRIDANGNVLIGKTSQINTAYKLDVNGPIRVSEVVVNTTGADFVFDENYALRKLEEVESFIKANKHLPEIEPAKEMQGNGLDLGKMNIQLLQKVEELTLYLIEADKTSKKQNERINALEKAVEKK